jgi:hypothetical protein
MWLPYGVAEMRRGGRDQTRQRRRYPAAVVLVLASLALGACTGSGGESRPAGPATAFTSTACGTYSGRGCAPPGRRVDLARPSFSNPTEITNPLFPISRLRSTVLLGHVDGKPFRTETTLLPGTRTVEWAGRRIPVLVSQYMAYLDGRLTEVAIDRYAQADDGSVWYLGEDVFDYENGTVAATEGSWLAGRDGPAAMIMPARPQVGDVFRPENVPGIVFEEVTVAAAEKTVPGPAGAVTGSILTDELHADRTHEDKLFAPGYGEFRTAGGGDLEALAMSVPRDARPGPPPAELTALSTRTIGVLELSRLGDWEAATANVGRMNAEWRTVRAQRQPRMVAARLDASLQALVRAVRARKARATAQAAIAVEQSVLDLELRYRPAAEVDADRFSLWTQQVRVDAAANDLAGVTGDVAVLEWIRDRFAYTLGAAGRREIASRLRALRVATDSRNLPAAADHAARLGARLHP